MKTAGWTTLVMGQNGHWTCEKCNAELGLTALIDAHRDGCPFAATEGGK